MSHDPDELFGAFASASDDSGEDGEANGVASDTDEDVHAEVEQLREENERLRSLLARFQAATGALKPICHVSFFDNKVSRACKPKIMDFLLQLAMQPLEDKDGTISTDARPSDVMTARLVQQMEYYFSSDNLMRPDLYMLDIMKSPDGYMPIEKLASFQKVVQLTANRRWILYALKRAPLLTLNADETAVRRVRPFTARGAQDAGVRDEEDDDSDDSAVDVVAAYTVLPGVSAVLDRHGCNPRVTNEEAPQYDLLTAIPLPHTHHDGLSMRMERRCFNCGAVEHALAACPNPRDSARIAANRAAHEQLRETMGGKPDMSVRYHADQRREFAHLKPGSITQELRDAIGLADHELPPWISNMWTYGYPPGYLKRAGAEMLTVEEDGVDEEPSGITLYGADGHEEPPAPTPVKRDGSDLLPPEQLVAYPGYNIPPPPGIVVNDPKNKYSQNHNPSRDVMRAMQVHQAHYRKTLRDQIRAQAHPYASPQHANGTHSYAGSPQHSQAYPYSASPQHMQGGQGQSQSQSHAYASPHHQQQGQQGLLPSPSHHHHHHHHAGYQSPYQQQPLLNSSPLPLHTPLAPRIASGADDETAEVEMDVSAGEEEMEVEEEDEGGFDGVLLE